MLIIYNHIDSWICFGGMDDKIKSEYNNAEEMKVEAPSADANASVDKEVVSQSNDESKYLSLSQV